MKHFDTQAEAQASLELNAADMRDFVNAALRAAEAGMRPYPETVEGLWLSASLVLMALEDLGHIDPEEGEE